MKIEIAEHGRMTESGSSLLRLIQNQDMPLLDLLVRESVQNSLDAVKKGAPYANVDFHTGSFVSKELNKHFEKVDKALDKRFPCEKGPYDFIEIRDTNTNGLTGPVRYDDVKNNEFGNLLKLVYEICKSQQAEGAGGSWGLGKTIYFRLGIGLVIYYSRIEDNGKYVSRLAACFVEDETKSNSVIPHDKSGVKRGIAWWGAQDGIMSKHTVPTENEKEILQILSVFGLKPFSGKETGTSVIIPYISRKKLLNETYAINEEIEHKPYWTNSVDAYLNVAVQRWYAPRIENRFYPYGSYLSTSVNGKKILPEKMLPLFRVMRELYIRTFNDKPEENAMLSQEGIEVKKEEINLRNVFANGQTSGWLTFVKLSTEQLKMLPPENEKSPYHQISNKHVLMDSGNVPVIMYTRRPGMIVGYDYNGTWTHRMPHTSENEFVIGLFILNTKNILKIPNINQTKPVTLEEYIRQGEKADHASWADRIVKGRNFHIVQNIQKQVIRKIASNYTEKNIDTAEKKNIGLGHALADILLPSSDFGRMASTPPRNNGGGNGTFGSRKKAHFNITDSPSYSSGKVTYNFEMCIKDKSCITELLVVTDFKKLKADSWESKDEIGKKFPLSLIDFTVSDCRKNTKNAKAEDCSVFLGEQDSEATCDKFSVTRITSENFGVPSAIRIDIIENDILLHGTISFRSEDTGLKGIFEFREVQ